MGSWNGTGICSLLSYFLINNSTLSLNWYTLTLGMIIFIHLICVRSIFFCYDFGKYFVRRKKDESGMLCSTLGCHMIDYYLFSGRGLDQHWTNRSNKWCLYISRQWFDLAGIGRLPNTIVLHSVPWTCSQVVFSSRKFHCMFLIFWLLKYLI